VSTQFVQSQNQIMGQLTIVKRNQSISRPQFSGHERYSINWKPRPQQEAKALATLNLVGMVNIEETTWCSPFQEPHQEDECPSCDEDSSDGISWT